MTSFSLRFHTSSCFYLADLAWIERLTERSCLSFHQSDFYVALISVIFLTFQDLNIYKCYSECDWCPRCMRLLWNVTSSLNVYCIVTWHQTILPSCMRFCLFVCVCVFADRWFFLTIHNQLASISSFSLDLFDQHPIKWLTCLSLRINCYIYTIDKFEMYLSLYTIVVQVFKLNSNLCPRTENNIGDKIFTAKISWLAVRWHYSVYKVRYR